MPDDKFEKEDLPKIYAALETARKSGQFSTVTIVVSANGGMVSCSLKMEKNFK